MTTQQPTPAPSDHDDQTAAVTTWSDLTPDEQEALKRVGKGFDVFGRQYTSLFKLGLIKNTHGITDAGRALLASAPVSTSARPKTVTWKQLMTRGNEVFAAWLEDQCELCFVGYTIKSYDNEEKQMIFFMDGGMQPMSDDKVLTVRWRLPVPTASDAGETAEAADIRMKTNTPYDWNDCIEDISKALGREYDPETPVYEYVESISALRQQLADAQAANGALKTALIRDIDNKEAYELGEATYDFYRRFNLGSRFWSELDGNERASWIHVGREVTAEARKWALSALQAASADGSEEGTG